MVKIKKIKFAAIPALIMLMLLAAPCVFSASAAEPEPAASFKYEVMENGEIKLTSYTGNEKMVTVPSQIDGYIVSTISAGTFREHDNMTYLYIPENITLIEDEALPQTNRLTVYGKVDSYAQTAAVNNSLKFRKLSDGSYAQLLLDKYTFSLVVGETAEISASAFPVYQNESYSYISSDTSVVDVENNTIVAKSIGKATITVKCNDILKKCNVNVYAPAEIVNAKDSVELGSGENLWLDYKLEPAQAKKELLKIESSDKKIAEFKNGRIYAAAPGSTQIKMSYLGKIIKTVNVTVRKAPEKIYLSHSSITAAKNEIIPIYSSVDSGSAAISRTYESSDSSVALIERKGWNVSVKAVSEGSANITVRSYNGKTAVCKVTVKNPAKDVKMSKKEITIGLGETYKLSSNVKDGASYYRYYYSWNNNKAIIDQNGNVKGMKIGRTTVAVKTVNGKKDVCIVIIKAAPKKINIGTRKLILQVGESYVLNSRTDEKQASAARVFSIEDENILSLDKKVWSGKITAKKVGTTKVTVRTYNGKTDVCTVKVVKECQRKRTVDYAMKWLGYNEADGSSKEILQVYNDGRIPDTYYMHHLDPWCAAYASAVFMKSGLVGLIYPSCSCPTMVRGAMGMGIWQEDDAFVPQRGDLIFYNWDDDGIGDCQTGAYHVGIIVDVNSDTMTVIEGNRDDNDLDGDNFVGFRKVRINEEKIRGFITPEYKD